MAKIAVTGASGHIGKRLCDDLARDHEVVRIDVRGAGTPVDAGDLGALEAAFAGCETVIHLARAGGGTKATWDDTYQNIGATYNAFEAAHRNGCKRMIVASSNHAVGMYEVKGAPSIYEMDGTLLRTDVPLRADGYYGAWKAFSEILGRYYSDEYGMQVACLRIGTVREDGATTAGELVQAANGGGALWSTMGLTDAEKCTRMAAIYFSHRDLARLVRAILGSDVPFGVVYGVSDNASRFWDLEAGRTLYGFWPIDGIKERPT